MSEKSRNKKFREADEISQDELEHASEFLSKIKSGKDQASYEERLRSFAKKCGLSGHVSWLGGPKEWLVGGEQPCMEIKNGFIWENEEDGGKTFYFKDESSGELFTVGSEHIGLIRNIEVYKAIDSMPEMKLNNIINAKQFIHDFNDNRLNAIRVNLLLLISESEFTYESVDEAVTDLIDFAIQG